MWGPTEGTHGTGLGRKGRGWDTELPTKDATSAAVFSGSQHRRAEGWVGTFNGITTAQRRGYGAALAGCLSPVYCRDSAQTVLAAECRAFREQFM